MHLTNGQSQYMEVHSNTLKKDEDPILTPTDIKVVQQISGNLLYYARAIGSPILPALNEISHRQATLTQNRLKKCKMVLNFCASHPNSIIRYTASDMILHVDIDAEYLVLPQARSRIAGYF